MASPNNHGFNTVQNSRVETRRKSETLQMYTVIGVICMAVITVALLVVMAVGGLMGNDPHSPNGPANEKVDWGSFTVTATDTLYGDLVLVNNSHAYTFPNSTDHLDEIYAMYDSHNPRLYIQSGISTYMDKDALVALDKMLVAFHTATGKDNVQIRDAYRDHARQQELCDLGYSDILPGRSDHHTGLGCALRYVLETGGKDVAYDLSTDATYNWLFENCHKYGFVIRYPDDKADQTGVSDYNYYFRYVGIPHATYMVSEGLCMEEYIEELKEYDNEDPLEINAADGKTYEVYYVAVEGSATVKHPTNYAYTVSGTNEGGVVITVDRSAPLSETGTSADTSAAGN